MLVVRIVFVFLCGFFCVDGLALPEIATKTVQEYEEVYGEMADTEAQKDDYYDEAEEGNSNNVEDNRTEEDMNLKLVSKPERFVKNIGDVVVLPCDVSNSKNDPVRMWKKNSSVLYQGDFNTQNKENLGYLKNGSLVLTIQDRSDFGNYSCILLLSAKSQPNVTHEVINRGPFITSLRTASNEFVYSPGETLELICDTEGHPKPKVKWFKDSDRVGPEGATLTIPKLKVSDGGVYRCLADSEGKPAHKHLEIFVKHAPIVKVQEYLVNSDHKNSAELICMADAYPEPVAEWRKDGQIVYHNEPKTKMTHENAYSRNTLIIADLTENDFGTYSCIVRNDLGTESKNISLVRIPVVRKLEKDNNQSTKDVILQWKVESKQPISVHELQYRRKGDSAWNTITPAVQAGENDVYLIKHTLKNLEPGIYETRARSKNVHGWSNFSEIMPFEGTNKHSAHHHKQKHNKKEQRVKTEDSALNTPAQHTSEEHVGESTSGSENLHLTSCLITFTILSLIYHQVRERTIC